MIRINYNLTFFFPLSSFLSSRRSVETGSAPDAVQEISCGQRDGEARSVRRWQWEFRKKTEGLVEGQLKDKQPWHPRQLCLGSQRKLGRIQATWMRALVPQQASQSPYPRFLVFGFWFFLCTCEFFIW